MTAFMSPDEWGCQAGNTREAPTREWFCALAGDVVGRVLQGVGGGGDGRGADAVGRHVRGVVGWAVILRVLALGEAGVRWIFLGEEKKETSTTRMCLFLSCKQVSHHKSCVTQQVMAQEYFTEELHFIHLGNYISASPKYTPILLW